MLTDAAYVEIVESRGLEPASQIVSHHRGLGLEDGERDGSLSDRCSFWLERDDETTRQTFIFHHLVPQELEGGTWFGNLTSIFPHLTSANLLAVLMDVLFWFP